MQTIQRACVLFTILLLLVSPVIQSSGQPVNQSQGPEGRQTNGQVDGAERPNHVLSLDGDGDYVRIPDAPKLRGGPDVVKTIEAWFMPKKPGFALIGKRFDASNKDWLIVLSPGGDAVRLHMNAAGKTYSLDTPSSVLPMHQWYHVAVVIDCPQQLAQLYLNGFLVAEDADMPNASPATEASVEIGASTVLSNYANGLIDEVRVWNVTRTQQQIQQAMHRSLTGQEPGLVGYWNFEGTEEQAKDTSSHQHDGFFVGDAERVQVTLPSHIPQPCVLTGKVQDAEGKPVYQALVELKQGLNQLAQTWTDRDGSYRLAIFLPDGEYDLYATQGTEGAYSPYVQLVSGPNRQELTLHDAISIEGTAQMLDGETPHIGLVVQAVLPVSHTDIDPSEIAATALTDEWGNYRFINLKPGQYHLRCYIPGEYIYYNSQHGESAQLGANHSSIDEAERLLVRVGQTLSGMDFQLAPFKKGTWRTFTSLDGLTHNNVYSISPGPDGVLWLGTYGGGVSRYDGSEFVNLTTHDGLVSDWVNITHIAPDGVLWIGTDMDGASRYDGNQFTNFTTEDGLADDRVEAIQVSRDGIVWFGTLGGGVSRYDGETFTNFAAGDSYTIHEDSEGLLWFGTNGGVSRYDGTRFTNVTTADGLVSNYVLAIHQDADGIFWFGTSGGISRYDGKTFTNFTTRDGLAHNFVRSIAQDQQGVLWFGTSGGGVSTYDGRGFINYTTQDGLAENQVRTIHIDANGVLWFGSGWFSGVGGLSRYDPRGITNYTTRDGLPGNQIGNVLRAPDGVMWLRISNFGVCRYDGSQFTTLTTKDGLASNFVEGMYCEPDGTLWFGTYRGVSRYDGEAFTNFTTEDGLPISRITDIHRDLDGVLWFAAFGDGGGAVRYNDKTFTTFTTQHGLPSDWVAGIHPSEDGGLWFITQGGISHYDGTKFTNYGRQEGLIHNSVSNVAYDLDGNLWVSTNGGVSQYDGESFTNFTVKDGLAQNFVWHIHSGQDGLLWFGTDGSGVSAYDGTAWTSLDTRDGLAGNRVFQIHEDADGSLWFATVGGLSHYQRGNALPKVRIVSAQVNGMELGLAEVPTITAGKRLVINCQAIDYQTLPEKQQYRYRVWKRGTQRASADWNRPTKSSVFEWFPPRSGTYTFQVQCINRDLNYSDPAELTLEVVVPYYLHAIFLVPTVGGGMLVLVVAIVASVVAIRRRRQVHAYERYAAQELQDARYMQLSLLPEHAPAVVGAEIAGKCVTANTVGGDFFDYLAGRGQHQVGLVVADVSGKAMRGAMNAVMTAGIVRTVAEDVDQIAPGVLMSRANNTLATSMESDMNVTMVIGLLDTTAMTLTLANAAHHAYPLLVRDGAVTELKARGLPLGMRAGVQYREETFDLQLGDILVLMTDGIIEVHDADGSMYGDSGQLERLLSGFADDTSTEQMVDAVIQNATDYAGGNRDDDATVLVAKLT